MHCRRLEGLKPRQKYPPWLSSSLLVHVRAFTTTERREPGSRAPHKYAVWAVNDGTKRPTARRMSVSGSDREPSMSSPFNRVDLKWTCKQAFTFKDDSFNHRHRCCNRNFLQGVDGGFDLEMCSRHDDFSSCRTGRCKHGCCITNAENADCERDHEDRESASMRAAS